MGTYQLTGRFDVSRRIEWNDGEFATHIDTVVERLHQAQSVRTVEVDADLSSMRTTLTLVLSIDKEDDPRHHAAVLLAAAIRSCRAGHVGLLSMAEESVVRPEGNQWSGLRTPMWNVREMSFEPLTSDWFEQLDDE